MLNAVLTTLAALAAAYLGLMVMTWLVADAVMYPAPPSSYTDAPNQHKLSAPDGNEITAVFMENPAASHVLLFNHGNKMDLGTAEDRLREYRERGWSVFAYDYPGYGTSTGSPSEAGCCAALAAAFAFLTRVKGIPPGKIVLYGLSLGAGAFRDEGKEFFRDGEVGFELDGGEVAVVHADELCAMAQGAVEFPFFVDFKECIEARECCRIVQSLDGIVFKCAHNDENRPCAGLGGLDDLNWVQHEILAQTGDMTVGGNLELDHVPQIAQRAAEIFFIGEDGNAIGPGVRVPASLLDGVSPGFNITGGGRATLDFGNDAEAARLVEGLGEA